MSQLSLNISDLFTSSGMLLFISFYIHIYRTGSIQEYIFNTFLRSLSLFGIIVASVCTYKEYGTIPGIVRGILVLIVSFVIPTLILHISPNMVRRKRSAIHNIVFDTSMLSMIGLTERYIVPIVSNSFKK